MGVVAAIAGLVGVVGQMSQAKKLARAQKEGNAVASASGEITDLASRRRSAREERLRRARLIATSRAFGGAGSSGELGGLGALTTSFDSSVADQSSQRLAAQGISAANQRAASAKASYDSVGLWTKLISQGVEIGQQIKENNT